MKNKFQSKAVPRGTRTIWRYLGALFLLFTFAIGNVWAEEVKLVSVGTEATQSSPNFFDSKTYKSGDESYSVTLSTAGTSKGQGASYGSPSKKDYYYSLSSACDMSSTVSNYFKVSASGCKISKVVVRAHANSSDDQILPAVGFVNGIPEISQIGNKKGRRADVIIDNVTQEHVSVKKFDNAKALTYNFSTNVSEVYISKQIKKVGLSTATSWSDYPSSSAQSTCVYGIDVYVVPNPPTTYTVTLNPNGGTTTDDSWTEDEGIYTKSSILKNASVALPNFTLTGYTLAAWKNTNNETVNSPVTVTKDTTLNATWTVNKHSLTWDANGGTITSADEAYTHGTAVAYGTTIVAPTVEWAGHDFLGWGTVASTMPDNNLVYTAQWQTAAVPYDITFEKGDNTAATVPDDTNASNVILASVASDDNYSFDGWKANVDVKEGSLTGTTITAGTMIASGTQVFVTQATNFTAQWTPKYAVTFNSKGGTAVATQYIVSGGTAEAPTAPTRLNYDFEGWQLAGVDYDFSTTVTEPITLDAVWTRKAIPSSQEDFVIINGTTVNTGGTLSVGHYFSANTSNNHVKYSGAMRGTGCRFTTFTIPSGYTGIVKEATVYTAKTFVIIPASDISGIDFENNTSADATVTYDNAYFSLTGASGGKSEDEADFNNIMPAGTYYCGSTGSGLEIGKLTLTLTTVIPTVKLKVNGEVTQTITVTVGEKLGEIFAAGSLPSIDITGYSFNGWKNEANDEAVDNNTDISGSMVIYADLEADEYNVALENGENDGAATVHYGDDALTITTPVVGEVDNMLLGYFTAATEGTKVADGLGNLVAGVDGYTDANGKWNKEAGATLYAQWQAIDFCYTFAPSASTGDIAAGDEITTSFDGKMTMVKGAMSYAQGDCNMVLFTFADNVGAVAEVELSHKLQAGSIIKVDMHQGGTSTVRGLELQTAAGDNVANLAWNPANADDTVIYYTVGLGNPLIGKTVFRLARYQGNVYLRSLKVGACGNEAFKVTFDLQGHGDAIEAQYVETNALVTAPSDPTTTDLFTFGGWYKEAACTNAWNFAEDKVTAATTIFAKWIAIPELEDEYVWKKGTSYTGCVAGPNDDAAAPLYTSVTVVGMEKMSSGRPSEPNTDVTVTIASAQEGYAIKSICTYGKLEEPAGAQISWDDGNTWEALAAYSEGQKSFNAPMAKFPTNFKLKFTGVSTSSGGLWWRNALVTLELIKTQDGDPVVSLVGAKVNGTAISETDFATLQGSQELDITTSYVEAPVVSFVKRTTINFTDETSVYEDEDVDVTATENTSSKWEALATINNIEYTVTLAIPTDPILDTETTALTLVSAKNKADSKSFTFSGRNLSSDVTISLAFEVDGLTVSPTAVTPDANGKITEQEVTVSYASLEDVAEANVVLTVAYSETVKKEITLTYSSTKGYAVLADVTGDFSWDFSKAAPTVNVPISNTEVTILANYDVVNSTDEDKIVTDNIEVKGERVTKTSNIRANYVHFHTTVPGRLTLEYSNTGGNNDGRTPYINGGMYDNHGADNSTHIGQYNAVYVPAGDVVIEVRNDEEAVKNIQLYRMTFVAQTSAMEADYTRDVTEGRYGTICLPNGGYMFGTAIFEIAYMDYVNNQPYKIYFDEVLNGKMEAGMPYIFLPNEAATQLEVFYSDSAAVAARHYHGLYGSYTKEPLAQNDGNYILKNNQYYLVNSDQVYVGENRAYIYLSEVPNYNPGQPANGRRRVSMNVNAEQTTTDLENLSAGEQPMKMVIDGKLFILRGEKLFDATGRLVK